MQQVDHVIYFVAVMGYVRVLLLCSINNFSSSEIFKVFSINLSTQVGKFDILRLYLESIFVKLIARKSYQLLLEVIKVYHPLLFKYLNTRVIFLGELNNEIKAFSITRYS